MPFESGKSGNPKGRPIGARNHATSDLVKRVEMILGKSMKRLQDDLDSMSAVERVKAITNLIGYVIPKKQALNVQQSLDYEYQKLEELLKNAPEEAVERIIERIKLLREREGNQDE